MKRYISAIEDIPSGRCRSRSRILSPSSVPPGSRTTSGLRSLRARARRVTCVDLPEPSGPSKVMNRPGKKRLLGAGGEDAKAALGLLAGALRLHALLVDELVLEPP